jgi:HPt (histidine-containing phosphotransfer) domain-containing protein
LEDIPVIEMLSQGDTDVFTDMKDDMEEMADTMDDGMDAQADELEDMLTKGQIRKLEKFAKSVRKCAGTLSVANFNQMINRFEKVAKMDVDEVGDLSDELDDVRQAKTAIAVISGILVVGALGIGAFLFLGGYFQKNVLSILGAIGAFFYCLMGCGILLLLLVMLSVIAMIYMTKGVNSAYKEHLKTK